MHKNGHSSPNGTSDSKDGRPVAVDLFAGAGGLSLGFEQAGFDVVSAVEFDPIHAATHAHNFPHTAVICRDIRELSGSEIRSAAGLGRRAIDAVVGGPPCQGFSQIGHRMLDDPRNALVFHFVRLVDELRPRTLVMENVPGMAAGPHAAFVSELVGAFGEIGYRLCLPYRILNASSYGVPQDRRRLFLIGARRDVKLPDYPMPRTRPPLRPSDSAEDFNLDDLPITPTVLDAIRDLPDIDEFDDLFQSDWLRMKLRGGSEYARILRGDQEDPTDLSYPRGRDNRLQTGFLRARHTEESRRRFQETVPGSTEPISRFLRLNPSGLSNTLRSGTASDRGAFGLPGQSTPSFHGASP